MRILFFGSGDFAIPTFRSIHGSGHELVGAVTQPDKPRGGGDITPTPLKHAAIEHNVQVLSPTDVNAPEIVEQLKAMRADLAYVAAFGQKIGPELLRAFPVGIVNLHASLLPELRGAAPIQWAVIRGQERTGVTIFRLVEKMDAGPILVQRRTGIGEDETADELHDRLSRIGCNAVKGLFEILESDPAAPGATQDAAGVTLAPKLTKADGRITFDRPMAELSCRIRGLWSWPGATCRFRSADAKRDETVILARAVPYEGKTNAAASPDACGRLTEMMSVQCLDGEIMVLEIKPAGGRLMAWQDFVNGRHVRAGDRFEAIYRRFQ